MAPTKYSSNEQLEELIDRDPTTNVIGFIDKVTSPSVAGKKGDYLINFVVSNGNKGVTILIWGRSLINKYVRDIRPSRIIKINVGFCRAISQTIYNEVNNLVPFEVIVRDNTQIKFDGYHVFDDHITSTQEIQKACINTIHAMEGLVEMSVWIKTNLSPIHNQSGSIIYGIGAITDKTRKVNVHIKKFDDLEPVFEIGQYITVTGTIQAQGSLITINCNSLEDVKPNSEKEAITEEDTELGYRPVKRGLVRQ